MVFFFFVYFGVVDLLTKPTIGFFLLFIGDLGLAVPGLALAAALAVLLYSVDCVL